MKISTKTGDLGATKLMFGKSVLKCAPRVCAYGALDDFAATLGLARSFAGAELAAEILKIQENLVFLMTELATSNEDYPKLVEKNFRLVGEADLAEIETRIDELERDGEIFSGWKHSGENSLQAALDMARSRCRAAEREIVALNEIEPLPRPFTLKYVNRLSDLMWLLSQSSK